MAILATPWLASCRQSRDEFNSMYSDSGHSELMGQFNEASKSLAKAVLDKLEPCGEIEEYNSVDDLYAQASSVGKFFYILDGCLAYEREAKVGFYYENGDIVGLDHQYEGERPRLHSEFYAKIKPYSYADLMQLIDGDADARECWTQYLVCYSSVLATSTTILGGANNSSQLGFETFAPGEVIIKEGDVANEVYTIVEGHAEAFVNGVKVGDIHEEEIFGDMALFTKSPRTATVIAARTCMVLVVEQDQFFTLVKTHPKVCISLIEHMAKKIVSLNEQIIGRSSAS